MSRSIAKRTAFIALFEVTEIYRRVAEAADGDVEAFFVTSTPRTMSHLLAHGVSRSRILDLSETRGRVRRMAPSPEELRVRIDEWETAAGVSFPSMILMSRFHRGEPADSLLHYMGRCAARMEKFFVANGIEWVIAEPTNVVELLAYAVSRRLGIPFGHIAHVRFPSDRLALFSDIFESRYHPLAPAAERGPGLAVDMAAWLEQFRRRPERPAYFAGQSKGRSSWRLARAAAANLRSAVLECAGGTQINDYRFLQKVSLHLKPYLGSIKRRATEMVAAPPSFQPREPYVVYFLHVYPERSVDVVSPWHNDQVAIITALRRATPTACEVLVKEHPSAAGWQTPAFYSRLGRVPGIRLLGAGFDSRRLMLGAAMTVTLSGTAAYEAALLGRPALIFSDVFFRVLPGVRRCNCLPELPAIIVDALAAPPTSDAADDSGVVDYLVDIHRNSERALWDGKAGSVTPELAAAMARLLRRGMRREDASQEQPLAYDRAR